MYVDSINEGKPITYRESKQEIAFHLSAAANNDDDDNNDNEDDG
jgi:hypothetical protein